MTTVPNVTLANGVIMPAIAYGVFRMKDLGACEQAVLDALNAGYRFIDTATAYRNEEAVGRAIARSGIPREELFISTKLWVPDTNYERARAAFECSLEKLGLDYVDLYFIHQPYNDVFGAWRALVELVEEGRIRALGLDNFTSARMANFLAFNDIAPMIDFIEVNPFCQQLEAVPYLQSRSVQPMAWSPLGAGAGDLFDNPALRQIADAHGKSIAQVVLRWIVQRGIVPAVKSANPVRMRENLDVFDFELTENEMAAISQLDRGISAAARSTGAEVDAFLAAVMK